MPLKMRGLSLSNRKTIKLQIESKKSRDTASLSMSAGKTVVRCGSPLRSTQGIDHRVSCAELKLV
jgi:hypothetical protein